MSRRLIETWLPIAALGEESVRERRSMTALPPVYYLHVWWARRPLVASRAAILASLLPADADRDRFMHVLGIHGDPVASRRRIDEARRKGDRFEGEAYSYRRAFLHSPTPEDQTWARHNALRAGLAAPIALDPTAGGGSIPLEAIRLGISTYANDINPVAAFVLRATVEFPSVYGYKLLDEFKRQAAIFQARREELVRPLFAAEPDADCIATNFLWARTVICPYCEGVIPLAPSWRLNGAGIGVRLEPDPISRSCSFRIVTRIEQHSEGTVTGGDARCPYPECGRVVPNKEIKVQGTAHGLGEQLFAVVFRRKVVSYTKTGKPKIKWVRGYRAARVEDYSKDAVNELLRSRQAEWESEGLIPTEALPMSTASWTHGNTPAQYGAERFIDLHSPRQLACLALTSQALREIGDRYVSANSAERSVQSVAWLYLCVAFDSYLNYQTRCCRWDSLTERVRSLFDRHDFAFIWTYAEMSPLIGDQASDWILEKTSRALEELIELTRPDLAKARERQSEELQFDDAPQRIEPPPVTITCQSGDSLTHIDDHTIDCVVMDPPYYDNVMYAELSDFFYVWLKRTAGRVYPELFRRQLTDKENEAVANAAKFDGQKGAKALAARDYRERMAGIFAECRRVLKPDGIMTLMFTHKATGAWDALASGLMEAGFTITASWPINTEAEGSLHIKDKSAANSTIFLVCRPRPERKADEEAAYWEDVEPRVAKAVRERVEAHQAAGIAGVDLYLSCFGPALEEFAKHWPLQRGTPRVIPVRKRKAQEALFGDPLDPYAVTPEDALDAARREVKQWRLEKLLRAKRQDDLDPLTEWFVLAWDAFRAPEFPYDEALRLARVVGVDLDLQVVGRLAEKKASDLVLWDSAKRAAKGAIGAADGSAAAIDAVHNVAWRVRQVNLEAGRDLVQRARLDASPGFMTALAAVLEVLPVSSTFTKVASEKGAVAEAANDFEALEQLRRLMFTDRVPEPEQLKIWTD
jgi:putative DNA methylase